MLRSTTRGRGAAALLCSLALGLGAAACGSDDSSEGDSGSDGTIDFGLNFAPAPVGEWSGMIAAKQSGIYEDAGLDVTFTNLPGSADVVKAVGSGQLDVAFASPDSFLVGVGQGLPLVAIANVVPRGYTGVIAPADSGIESFADLDGKKVTTAQSSPEPLLLQALDGDAEPQLVFVEPQSKCTLMQSGESDACTGAANFQVPTLEMAGAEVTFLPFDSDELPIIGPVIITRPELVEERADDLKKLLEATSDGYVTAYGDVPAVLDQYQKQFPDIDATGGFLEEAIGATKPFLTRDDSSAEPGWGQMSDELWDNLAGALFDGGMLKEEVDPASVYTNELLPTGEWSLPE